MRESYLKAGLILAVVASINIWLPVGAVTVRDNVTWREAQEALTLSEDERASSVQYMRFLVTGVNPSKNTMKIFNNEAHWRQMMGGEEVQPIRSLKVMMRTEPLPYVSTWGLLDAEHEHAVAMIYDSETEVGFLADGLPRDKEVEVVVPQKGLLAGNMRKVIEYVMESNGGSAGGLDYGMCLEADDYREGMECRMMISDEGRIAYWPVEVVDEVGEDSGVADVVEVGDTGDVTDVVEAVVSEVSEIVDVASEVSETVTRPVVTTKAVTSVAKDQVTERLEARNLGGGEKKEVENGESTDVVKNNETGVGPEIKVPELSGAKECVDNGRLWQDMWWLLLILVGLDVLVMWWFWPDQKVAGKSSGKML